MGKREARWGTAPPPPHTYHAIAVNVRQELSTCPTQFQPSFGPVSPSYAPLLRFRMGMLTLRRGILEACYFLF